MKKAPEIPAKAPEPEAEKKKGAAKKAKPAAAAKKKSPIEAVAVASPVAMKAARRAKKEAPPEVTVALPEKKSKPARKKKQFEARSVEPHVEPPVLVEAPKAEEVLPEAKPAKAKKVRKNAKPPKVPVGSESGPAGDVQVVAPAEGGESNGQHAPDEIQVSEGAEDHTDGEAEPVAKPVQNLDEISRTIEALLFAAEEPLAVREMARAAGSDSATVRKILPTIKAAYDTQRRPWDLVEIGGAYRLFTRSEFFPAIQRLKNQTAQRKLTQAALETLALIAYRQPIGRAEIESVRGVGAGPVLRVLLEKKLIQISGRGSGLGQPLLYGTTDFFLEHFGLKSIQELPKPGELKAV